MSITKRRRITSAQKMVLTVLDEGWSLRKQSERGWCLYRPEWERPLAHVSDRNVREMTEAGWLSQGEQMFGLSSTPIKQITPLGRAFAIELAQSGWGRTESWRRRNSIDPRDNDPYNLKIAA